jgi:peptidoglycan/LPS O-acetylase OafA/YrhL
MSDTKNNFDFLRLLFASFVIITHSYALSGNKECDLLCQYTNGQVSFSYLGVRGFFVISGYLVFQSLKRSRNIFDYSIKRILRLYPALILMLILTILFVPFVYESAIPYFKNKSI